MLPGLKPYLCLWIRLSFSKPFMDFLESQIPMTLTIQIFSVLMRISFSSLSTFLHDYKVWNFGHWNLFVFWDLLFGISTNSITLQMVTIFLSLKLPYPMHTNGSGLH